MSDTSWNVHKTRRFLVVGVSAKLGKEAREKVICLMKKKPDRVSTAANKQMRSHRAGRQCADAHWA